MVQRLLILGLVAGFAVLLYASPGSGYPSYSGNNGTSNCANSSCHGDFRAGDPSVHSIHVGATQMTNNCELCHGGGDSFGDVRTGSSGAFPDQYSCTGCHLFAGLLARHSAVSGCGCHNPHPTPEPENVIPPYYGRNDVTLENPCRIGKNNGGEDWDLDGLGLDNDGDGEYDYNDADCVGVSSPENSWGAVKSVYGTE